MLAGASVAQPDFAILTQVADAGRITAAFCQVGGAALVALGAWALARGRAVPGPQRRGAILKVAIGVVAIVMPPALANLTATYGTGGVQLNVGCGF